MQQQQGLRSRLAALEAQGLWRHLAGEGFRWRRQLTNQGGGRKRRAALHRSFAMAAAAAAAVLRSSCQLVRNIQYPDMPALRSSWSGGCTWKMGIEKTVVCQLCDILLQQWQQHLRKVHSRSVSSAHAPALGKGRWSE